MSLSKEEVQLLENVAAQVVSLRQEIGAWEKRVTTLDEQNGQLSQQITSLNAENKRLSDWVAHVSQQVVTYYNEGVQSEERLTGLIQQLAAALK